MNKSKFFFFTNTLDEVKKNNILKFKNISIIYKPEKQESKNLTQIEEIKKFCKKNKILLYIIDDYKLMIKHNSNGIFLSSTNRNLIKPMQLKKNISIIGSAHNMIECQIKNKQNCEQIMLSPLFYNKKYSNNKILGIVKFNLISLNWKIKICALGGINLNNIKKIKMCKAYSIAFISLINEPKIKKPVYCF